MFITDISQPLFSSAFLSGGFIGPVMKNLPIRRFFLFIAIAVGSVFGFGDEDGEELNPPHH
ncbi:hypothetical protein ACVGWI_00030, partial [Enterobacter hormaechei]